MNARRRLGFVLALAVAAASSTAAAAEQATPGSTTANPKPSAAAPARKTAGAATQAEFERLVKAADEARAQQQWLEAIKLYKAAVKLKPDYAEGYWYQGTSHWTLEEFGECKNAFRQLTRLAPKNGAAYAFLGLCEYGLKEYDRSLEHLIHSRILGVGDLPELGNAARYHAAVLMARIEQFEQALETLGEFGSAGDDNPRIIEAMGLATLRMPMLPIEAPPDRREMILMAGRASYMMATRNMAGAQKAFEALVMRYPETPNVHYAYGVYLLQEQGDKALEEFKRELEVQPGHPQSLMQIAYEYLKRGDGQAALPFAQQAAAAAPNAFPARRALGQALLETGDVDGAIKELLVGIKLAPESPSLHFTLARAYQRAGKMDEAAKAREEFMRLDRLARTRKSGAQSIGGT